VHRRSEFVQVSQGGRYAPTLGNGQIQKSGKLNTRREDGISVLDWAKIGRHREAIQLLERASSKSL
jgi:hypothetical protein